MDFLDTAGGEPVHTSIPTATPGDSGMRERHRLPRIYGRGHFSPDRNMIFYPATFNVPAVAELWLSCENAIYFPIASIMREAKVLTPFC
jgi:hypothetical protein